MYYVLLYDYVEDVATKRTPYREQHLALVRKLHERGDLLMAGAWANPLDGAALVFRVDSPKAVEDFVAADPYVKHGLVTRWRIREWSVAVGG